MHALGLEFGSAAQLSKRPGSVLNCLWGNVLKRSPGIIRKSRVSYPGPGFLSSATWPSLPKKHYNGLNQTKPNPHLDEFKSISGYDDDKFRSHLFEDAAIQTCSCLCWVTSRPLMYSTWSPSLSRGIHKSAGVLAATRDTMMGMPWSIPPWKRRRANASK